MRIQTNRTLTAMMITIAAICAGMLLLPGDPAIAQAPAKGAPAKGKVGKGKFGKAGKGKGKAKGGFGGPDIDSPRGLVKSTPDATPGYVLFAPMNSVTSYLVDINGQMVHSVGLHHDSVGVVLSAEERQFPARRARRGCGVYQSCAGRSVRGVHLGRRYRLAPYDQR